MGVMSFSDNLPVWGGNSWLCRSMIENAIKEAGSEPYLLALKQSFDHGYNHANMEPLNPDQLIEFRDASIKWFRAQLHGSIEKDGMSELFDSFVDLIARRLEQLGRG